jgi:hypothetical protein
MPKVRKLTEQEIKKLREEGWLFGLKELFKYIKEKYKRGKKNEVLF